MTRVMSFCDRGDYSRKRFLPILLLSSRTSHGKERMKTRNLLVTVFALIAGFAIGMMLSEVIGIVGMLGFGRVVGIKYLPVYLAIVSAIVANLVEAFVRHKSKRAMDEPIERKTE